MGGGCGNCICFHTLRGFHIGTETEAGASLTLFNNLFNTVKSTGTDKQDISCVHLNKILLGMFSATLWGNIGNSTLQDFKKCLLNALTANISCDRWVFGFAGNFIYFVNINYTTFSLFHIIIGGLY